MGTFGVLYHVNQRYYTLSMVEGTSMIPTFKNKGDVVLVSQVSARTKEYTMGDIVLAFHKDPKRLIVKRVRGLEGDTVPVLRNRWNNAYIEYVTVPEGYVWLCGDNARVSVDSNVYGPIPQENVFGKVIAQVWPPNRLGLVENTLEHQERYERHIMERYEDTVEMSL